MNIGAKSIRQQLVSSNQKYLIQSFDNEILVYVNVHLQMSDQNVI